MTFLWALILLVLNLLWFGLTVIGLPGNWLMVISAVVIDWLVGDRIFSYWVLIAVLVLAAVGELLEFAAGVVGSRAAGGSRGGAAGALVGGIVGAILATFLIPIPVIGSILGACGGAFLGALGMELRAGRGMMASVRSGVGAGKGRFYGTVAKVAVAAAIWITIAVAAFWP